MHGQWPLVGGRERSVLSQSMKKWKQRRWAGAAAQGRVSGIHLAGRLHRWWRSGGKAGAGQVERLEPDRWKGRCWTGGKAGAVQVGRQVLDRQVLDKWASRCYTGWQAGAGQVDRQVPDRWEGRCWKGGQKAARARETEDMDKSDLFYGFLLICSILR